MSFLAIFAGLLSLSAAHVIPSITAHHPDLPSNLHSRQAPKLPDGAWIINYKPADSSLPTYRGPMRITSDPEAIFISGDLFNGTVVPNPADGSPILPRANYWAYVRATNLSPAENNGFGLGLEFYRYLGIVRRTVENYTDWEEDPKTGNPIAYKGGFNVTMVPAQAPTGFPDPKNYFEGQLKTQDGELQGTLTMGWVSKYVRRFTVEILTATGVPAPLNDSKGENLWKKAYNEAGIDIEVKVGKTDITPPQNPGLMPEQWTSRQQEQAIIDHRGPTDFDKQFKFHLICVKKLEGTARGHVIDQTGAYNSIPRDGAAIASEWIVGTHGNGTVDNTKPGRWPQAIQGKKFYELWDAYYRTAIHEVGHMVNIYHPNDFSFDIMSDSDTWADAGNDGTTEKPFPDNITREAFKFIEQHKYHMRHRPDTHVRPGWVNMASATNDKYPPMNFGMTPI